MIRFLAAKGASDRDLRPSALPPRPACLPVPPVISKSPVPPPAAVPPARQDPPARQEVHLAGYGKGRAAPFHDRGGSGERSAGERAACMLDRDLVPDAVLDDAEAARFLRADRSLQGRRRQRRKDRQRLHARWRCPDHAIRPCIWLTVHSANSALGAPQAGTLRSSQSGCADLKRSVRTEPRSAAGGFSPRLSFPDIQLVIDTQRSGS